eukprot:2847870-Rhodomonas_salina.1
MKTWSGSVFTAVARSTSFSIHSTTDINSAAAEVRCKPLESSTAEPRDTTVCRVPRSLHCDG